MIVSPLAAMVVGGAFAALWIVSVLRRDASLVDILWGPAYAAVAFACLVGRAPSLGQWGLVGLVTIWGVRLGGYLAWRNLGHGEDRRYAQMRARIGPSFWWVSAGTVYLLQAVLVLVVSLPVQAALTADAAAPSPWLYLAGVVAWMVGLAFEAGGDAQLARFKADPDHEGKVLDTGFWRYTRHPNYFGDFMVWWGHYLVALSLGAPWWTAVGPLVMSGLLMKVSGVPLLEKSMKQRRPAYADYVARTSAFFPRPPRDP